MKKQISLRPETKKKMRPITKDAFHKLLNKAATTVDAKTEKPARKRKLT
jgi:hypothetical protein